MNLRGVVRIRNSYGNPRRIWRFAQQSRILPSTRDSICDDDDIIPSIKTDHSAIIDHELKEDDGVKGPVLWKLDCSVLRDDSYVNIMQSMTSNIKHNCITNLYVCTFFCAIVVFSLRVLVNFHFKNQLRHTHCGAQKQLIATISSTLELLAKNQMRSTVTPVYREMGVTVYTSSTNTY